MSALDFIFSRRSIRKFTEEKVSEAQIKLLLEAAMAAPTAMNMQPWHFVVIDDPEILVKLRGALPFGAQIRSVRDLLVRLLDGDDAPLAQPA